MTLRYAIAEVLSDAGRVDVLVNNAGVQGSGPVGEVPLAEFRRVMETNFFGVLRCIQRVLPGMRKRRDGHIVNVSTVGGRITGLSQGPYCASKFALEAVSEILAGEVKSFGIRVAVVELQDRIHEERDEYKTEDDERVPRHRVRALLTGRQLKEMLRIGGAGIHSRLTRQLQFRGGE